ncbi:acyl-CoA dehydrogenase family protein [Paeniroseomonas aquatica]|uniref:acyl-CoA dehydrogenase family protein n=1 Tax=Paeniroseomonas aquatica TaxID=373043 RepID=UPI003614171C
MPFTATPIVGGDAFDQACRIGQEADRQLALIDDPAGHLACLRRHWDSLAGLGWLAVAMPEEAGGAGGTLSDLAALAGGAGRGGCLCPSPLPAGSSLVCSPTSRRSCPGWRRGSTVSPSSQPRRRWTTRPTC